MIVAEVIQRVQSLYSKGVQSDDTRLTNRHIYNKLRTVRSKLLGQKAKEKQKISQWNYQVLPCIEMGVVSVHECPCVPNDGCTFLRSIYPIPRVLTDLNRHLIQSVTTLDGKTVFDFTTWEGVKNQKGDKYTSTAAKFFIRNEYLYITSNKELEVLTLTALFADIIDVQNFKSYCTPEQVICTSPLDMEFPIDDELLDNLIAMASDELVFQFGQMREDKINDGSDNTIMNIQRKGKR